VSYEEQALASESNQIDLPIGFCKRNGMILHPWTAPDVAQD
jgi:hypothetical protein